MTVGIGVALPRTHTTLSLIPALLRTYTRTCELDIHLQNGALCNTSETVSNYLAKSFNLHNLGVVLIPVVHLPHRLRMCTKAYTSGGAPYCGPLEDGLKRGFTLAMPF